MYLVKYYHYFIFIFYYIYFILKHIYCFCQQSKSQHNSEMQKIKRREEKARQARQAAIEELQRKREEKRARDKVIAQQEMVCVQIRIVLTFCSSV